MHYNAYHNGDPQKVPLILGNPHMGGCQNYGPFLGTLNIRDRIIIGTQKGTIILTTNHIVSINYSVGAFSLRLTCVHSLRETSPTLLVLTRASRGGPLGSPTHRMDL